MSLEPVNIEPEHDIILVLNSIENELAQFIKTAGDPEEKTTEQFVGDIVSNLQRREHVLRTRLEKALTQNGEYSMPNNWVARVLHQIEVLHSDNAAKSKVEMIAAHQNAFWSVVTNIKDILVKPEKLHIKVTKVESSEDHKKSG